MIILKLILHNSLVKGAQAFLDDMAAVWEIRMEYLYIGKG